MKRTHFINLIAGLVLVAFTATGFAGDKMSKKVKDKANGGGNEYVSVIVQYNSMPNTDEDDRLATLEAQNRRSYGRMTMRAMDVKASKLDPAILNAKENHCY